MVLEDEEEEEEEEEDRKSLRDAAAWVQEAPVSGRPNTSAAATPPPRLVRWVELSSLRATACVKRKGL